LLVLVVMLTGLAVGTQAYGGLATAVSQACAAAVAATTSGCGAFTAILPVGAAQFMLQTAWLPGAVLFGGFLGGARLGWAAVLGCQSRLTGSNSRSGSTWAKLRHIVSRLPPATPSELPGRPLASHTRYSTLPPAGAVLQPTSRRMSGTDGQAVSVGRGSDEAPPQARCCVALPPTASALPVASAKRLLPLAREGASAPGAKRQGRLCAQARTAAAHQQQTLVLGQFVSCGMTARNQHFGPAQPGNAVTHHTQQPREGLQPQKSCSVQHPHRRLRWPVPAFSLGERVVCAVVGLVALVLLSLPPGAAAAPEPVAIATAAAFTRVAAATWLARAAATLAAVCLVVHAACGSVQARAPKELTTPLPHEPDIGYRRGVQVTATC
jgi:hypothetical protein